MHIESVVVAVDFSPHAEVALRQAMNIARHCAAKLDLVHVGAIPDPPGGDPEAIGTVANAYRQVIAARLSEARAELDQWRNKVSGQGVELGQVVIQGFPDVVLCDYAAERRAQLLVLGTHGRTGAKRLLLGSIAEKTVRAAVTSVLVARPLPEGRASEGGFREIVVGVDFSAESDLAIEQAFVAAAEGATIHFVHSWNPMGPELGLDMPSTDAVLSNVEAELKQRVAASRTRVGVQRRISIETAAVVAPPAIGVLETADRVGADLIVVGTHGRRGPSRWLLGSVAESTVRHASCSVWVAR